MEYNPQSPPTVAPVFTSRRSAGVAFEMPGTKPRLKIGDVACHFGGLHARAHTIDALFSGLGSLASVRGTDPLDKKKVPLLAVGACSGGGKTEFLRWVFNECSIYPTEDGAKTEVQEKTLAVVNDTNTAVPKVTTMVTLFASFNQLSSYGAGEMPESAVIQRLLRSLRGQTAYHFQKLAKVLVDFVCNRSGINGTDETQATLFCG